VAGTSKKMQGVRPSIEITSTFRPAIGCARAHAAAASTAAAMWPCAAQLASNAGDLAGSFTYSTRRGTRSSSHLASMIGRRSERFISKGSRAVGR